MSIPGAASAAARRVAVCLTAAFGIDQAGRHLCSFPIDETNNRKARAALLQASGQHRAEEVALEQVATLLAAECAWRVAGAHGREAGLCAAVRASVGYSLRCAQSPIVDAGDGIFAVGAIPLGSVLSVYAGCHRCGWDALLDRILCLLFPCRRLQGYMLYQSDYSSMDGSAQTSSAQREAQGYVSPSACCQLVNHPPAGIRPNAVSMTISIPSSPAFRCLPVTSLWGPPSGDMRQVATLLVSVAAIEDGEEILMDYRFGAKAPEELPAWYTPCPTSTSTAGAAASSPSFSFNDCYNDYIRHEKFL